MKNILFVPILLLQFIRCYSQDDVKIYNNMTFYYLDNSNGYQANEMNYEMTDELKNNLKKLINRPDNYFFLYACNGQEPKMSNNLTNLLEGTTLKKYLAKDSKESDYFFDRQNMRDNLIDYPVKIKQNVEINMYLSAFAIKKIMQNIEDLPTPVLFPHELPVYLNSSELKIKMNIFINKEAATEIGEEKIKNYFTFCLESLNQQKIITVFSFL
jgi:hypothetical protein